MAVQAYKPLYTVKEAAKVLMINEPSVYQLMNQGKLPFLVLGRKKIKGSDLERFIETYPTGNTGELNAEKEKKSNGKTNTNEGHSAKVPGLL